MAFRWPTDPPGKPAAHTISWQEEQRRRYRESQAGNQQTHDAAAYNAPNPTGWIGSSIVRGIQAAQNRASSGPTNPAPGTGGPNGEAPAAPPVDPALQGMIASITAGRDSAVGQLEAQRPQVLADYGYKASGYDANGAPTGLAFDADNPYSKAALLLRNFNQQKAGTLNGMAAQGQLNSGAYQRAVRTNESDNTRANDALLKALTAALTGINSRINTVKTDANGRISNAILSRAPQS